MSPPAKKEVPAPAAEEKDDEVVIKKTINVPTELEKVGKVPTVKTLHK